jgi:uncharacterized damage-inducible protein DinB
LLRSRSTHPERQDHEAPFITMSVTTLKSLFGQKAWANSELFACLKGLPQEHAGHVHTCVRTLNHIYVVDRLFRAHLSGEPRPFDATNTKETPSVQQLCADVEATDAWYMAYVSNVAPTALEEILDFAFTDGDRGRMSREEILLHVITHGAYHRGNVGQVLKFISVVPPRDLYTKFLHQSQPSRRK